MLEEKIEELTGQIALLTAVIHTLIDEMQDGTSSDKEIPTPKATKKKAKKKATKKSAKSDEVSHDTVKALAKAQIANGKITRAAAKKLISDFGADKIDDLDEDDLIKVHKAFSEL